MLFDSRADSPGIAVLLDWLPPYNPTPSMLAVVALETAVNRRINLLIATGLFGLVPGCSYPRPILSPQGPIHYQQHNASYHDPYSDADAGPEVVGARPRDFQKPTAETIRGRWYVDNVAPR